MKDEFKLISGHSMEVIPDGGEVSLVEREEFFFLKLKASSSCQFVLVVFSTFEFSFLFSHTGIVIKPVHDAFYKVGFHLFPYTFHVLKGEFEIPITKIVDRYSFQKKDEFKLFCSQYESGSNSFIGKTELEFNQWKEKSIEKLKHIIFSKKDNLETVPEFKLAHSIQEKGYTLHSFECIYDADFKNEFLLSIPDQGLDNCPLLIGIHGHEGEWGKADRNAFIDEGHADDFIGQFARNNFAVLQPPTMSHDLRNKQRLLIGEWTLDCIYSLNATLKIYPQLRNRISVCGLSTGGVISMMLLALDVRIKTGVIAGALTTFYHIKNRFKIPPSCDCGLSHYLYPHFEMGDIASLIAPKRVLYQQGKLDQLYCSAAIWTGSLTSWAYAGIPQNEYDYQYERIEKNYKILNSDAMISHEIHSGNHRVSFTSALKWINNN